MALSFGAACEVASILFAAAAVVVAVEVAASVMIAASVMVPVSAMVVASSRETILANEKSEKSEMSMRKRKFSINAKEVFIQFDLVFGGVKISCERINVFCG